MKKSFIVASYALVFASLVNAGEVEVLHWWTSGGEAKAISELKEMLSQQGHTWKDMALPSGAGQSADVLLRERVKTNNPPAAALVASSAIPEWGALNALADLDDIAAKQRWDVQLPKIIAQRMSYNGHFVAVPVNVHRTNWLWISKDALRKAGAKKPITVKDFFETADKLKDAGIIPVALGGQPWQIFNMFDSVALGVGGPTFYKKAFVNLEKDALQGPEMEKALTTFRRIKGYVDSNYRNREWTAATGMVMRGEAGMQFMGDWAKAEFLAAGKIPGKDFICQSTPGTERAYTFLIDSFVMFKQNSPAKEIAQKALAETIMSGPFQEVFNRTKGSIPAGTAVDMSRFDFCGQESAAYFVATNMINSLFPAVSGGGQPASIANAIGDVVNEYWENDSFTTNQALSKLARVADRKPVK